MDLLHSWYQQPLRSPMTFESTNDLEKTLRPKYTYK